MVDFPTFKYHIGAGHPLATINLGYLGRHRKYRTWHLREDTSRVRPSVSLRYGYHHDSRHLCFQGLVIEALLLMTGPT